MVSRNKKLFQYHDQSKARVIMTWLIRLENKLLFVMYDIVFGKVQSEQSKTANHALHPALYT